MTPPPTPRQPPRWLRILTPLAAALCLSAGCSKSMSTSAPEAMFAPAAELPPAPVVDPTQAGYADDGAYLEAEFDAFHDEMSGEALGAERSIVANVDRARQQFQTRAAPPARDAKGKKNQAAKDQQDAAKAKAEGKTASDDAPAHGRQIIYVAGLQISVFDLENGMATVEAIPDRYGGWVHMRTPNQVVLRLPAGALKTVMANLADIGVVEGRTLNAQDVTAEYVDLESRIKVLRETQTQLLELLAESKTVEEALHVRAALDDVTMELEVALGRMRQLGDLIAFSTLTVTLVERGPQDQVPTHNDPFSWVDRLGVEATEWR